jgi:hypothetical protein
VHNITGASSLGALAWDKDRGLLWACSGFSTVGTIDLSTDVFTAAFGSGGCFDGLAYDGTDDTIWTSGDASSTLNHYTLTGTLILAQSMSGKIGSCGNSGIAVGGSQLFLANNGCSQIYQGEKDLSTVGLFATFPARLEDLECDPVTFSGSGVGAIWSIDAYDNILNAWEIPSGLCGLGGEPDEPDEPVTCDTQVAYVPDSSTFASSTTAVPNGPAGTFGFNANLTNTGSHDLSAIMTKISILTNGNLLLSADNGAGAVGDLYTLPLVGDYADGVLSPGESAAIPHSIGMAVFSQFDFFVDLDCTVAPLDPI